MRTKFSSITITVFCFISLLTSAGFSQSSNTASPDKRDEKSLSTPAPSPGPTPAPPASSPAPVSNDTPDKIAFRAAMAETNKNKQIELLEKFVADFPRTDLFRIANLILLGEYIKANPNDKDRIYGQAQKIVDAVKTDAPVSVIDNLSGAYYSVVMTLYGAGMDDKAEEFAQKGITLINEASARDIFRTKYLILIKLGQIALKKGDLKNAEQYLQQAIAGDYGDNVALTLLAEAAGKRKNSKAQLNYLIRADAKGALKKDQRAVLEELYVKRHGSTKGLQEMLDENYRRLNPLPMTVVKYSPSEKRAKRTVLAELFTGAACHPCITADLAFDGLLKRYTPSDVAVLIYDLHIPLPDPIANPATVLRSKYYQIYGTPTYVINGSDKQVAGGTYRKEAEVLMGQLTKKIDVQLERENEADMTLAASINNGVVKTSVNVKNVKGDYSNLRVYIGLVENELSYMGENGIRFHPMSVREFGGENRDGFVLNDKTGNFAWEFDLQKVSGDLKNYIDNYEVKGSVFGTFSFIEKKYEINAKNLSVVAFVQDEKTKNVLQTVFINLAETGK